jgi:CheY-like chemotaxis protein
MSNSLVRIWQQGSPESKSMNRRRFLLTVGPAAAYMGGLASQKALPVLGSGQSTFRRRLNRRVYAVDDEPVLTELYRLVLEPAGCEVKTFSCRAEALVALSGAEHQPGVLITDYRGYPISAEEFIRACRRVTRGLKILMATGYYRGFLGPLEGQFDGFLQKPFLAERLVEEVRLLVGRDVP